MEIVKKAARVLAVGTTLAGTPTAANALNIEGWRRSTNVEDQRDNPGPTTQNFTSIVDEVVKSILDDRSIPTSGPFDKDIEDAAKRINEEVAKEEAAKQIKIQDRFDTYKKDIDEKIKKEAAQQPPIDVGGPKL